MFDHHQSIFEPYLQFIPHHNHNIDFVLRKSTAFFRLSLFSWENFLFFHVNNISKRSLNVCSTAYQSSLSTDASESDETARKLVVRLSTRGEVLYPSNSASSHIEQGSSIPRKVQIWKSHNSPQTNLFNHFGVQNQEKNVFKKNLLRGT